MTTSLEKIPFLDELGEAELKDLLSKKSNDPVFQESVEAWSSFVKKVVGDSIDFYENRSILVCHVLNKSGFEDLLDRQEKDLLELNQTRLQIALRDSSGLRAIEHRIGQEVADFKEAWLIHEGSDEKTSLIESQEVTELSQWQPVSQTRRSSWKLMAAGFSLVIASVFVINSLDQGQTTVFSNSEGIENVTLPDGSTVRLIPGAVLKYFEAADTGFERQVELTQGKAFFDIVKSSKPFTIATPNAEAIVLGTSFGMEANRYFTEVVLAEGSVVLADANNHFGVEIEIAEEMKQMKINATYDYEVGVDYIVETISETLGADVLRTTQGFKITN